MEKVRQSYNNRINAWVKYGIMDDGTTRINSVKKSNPQYPYKNIRTR